MSRYYCPFCSPRYQFYQTRTDALKICDQCGDELIKVPFLNITKVIGFFIALAFLIPLLLMIVYLFQDLNNQRIKNSSNQIAFLSLNLDDSK